MLGGCSKISLGLKRLDLILSKTWSAMKPSLSSTRSVWFWFMEILNTPACNSLERNPTRYSSPSLPTKHLSHKHTHSRLKEQPSQCVGSSEKEVSCLEQKPSLPWRLHVSMFFLPGDWIRSRWDCWTQNWLQAWNPFQQPVGKRKDRDIELGCGLQHYGSSGFSNRGRDRNRRNELHWRLYFDIYSIWGSNCFDSPCQRRWAFQLLNYDRI